MLKHNDTEVTVDKETLLAILKENRDKHVEEYKKAVVVMSDHVHKKVASVLKKICESDYTTTEDILKIVGKGTIRWDVPTSYEKHYNRAIRMLELSVEDTIVLDDTTFSKFVMDEWSWKGNFDTIVSNYLGG